MREPTSSRSASIVYEMLTGLNPFAGATPSTLANVTRRAPPPPSSINPDLPVELVDIVVLRALNHALDRPPTAPLEAERAKLRRCAGLLDAPSPSARATEERPSGTLDRHPTRRRARSGVCGGLDGGTEGGPLAKIAALTGQFCFR